MRKSTFKATAAFMAALLICSSAVSCGKNETKTKTPQTADQLITNSYKSEELTAPDGVSSIDSLTYLKENDEILLACMDDSYNNVFYKTNSDFTDYTKLDLEFDIDEKASSSYSFTSSDDGKMYVAVTIITHGDMAEPDWNDENFDYESFDFDAYNAAAEYSYQLYVFGTDGALISNAPIDGMDAYSSDDMDASIGNITYCGDDKLIVGIQCDDEAYVIMNTSGKIEDQIDIGSSNWINYIGRDIDGNVVCSTYGDNGEVLGNIDIDSKKLSDSKIEIDSAGGYTIRSMICGAGDYKLFVPMSNGIYGVKSDDSMEEIVNWVDSDISSDYVNAILGLENGDFIVSEYDYNSSTVKLSRLTKRASDELADTMVFTIGLLWSDSEISSKITEFNKSNDKYRIKVKDYSEYDDYDEQSEKYNNTSIGQLKNDIISGNAPDMICVYDSSTIKSLASKGVFVDLYSYMENDTELNKDMILPNILTAFETDGKLFSITPSFTVSTYAAKAKYNYNENWTVDDMIDAYNNLPEDMRMFKQMNSKSSVFNMLNYFSSEYVDYENKTCSFDSPEYIKLLEFCNNFPTEEDDISYDTMTDEEINAYYSDQETMCRNDKALIDSLYISSFADYKTAKVGNFGEDITLVGTPSANGQGGTLQSSYNFAILNDSGCKDAAWDFIKDFFNTRDEDEENNNYSYTLSVIKDEFEKQADESMNRPYYYDEDHNKVEYDNTTYINNEEVKIDPLTQEERDYVESYITSITALADYDNDVMTICTEESDAYFNGEKSAEDAAKMIQNRASILISEQG